MVLFAVRSNKVVMMWPATESVVVTLLCASGDSYQVIMMAMKFYWWSLILSLDYRRKFLRARKRSSLRRSLRSSVITIIKVYCNTLKLVYITVALLTLDTQKYTIRKQKTSANWKRTKKLIIQIYILNISKSNHNILL